MFVTKRGFRVTSLTSVLLQSSNVTALMKGYCWLNNLMSAGHMPPVMLHNISGVTHHPLPGLLSVTMCSGFKSRLAPSGLSLCISRTSSPDPPSPPHVTVTGPGTRGLRRFKWPPPPPLLSSDLGSNRHCAAHNFWRELFLPSENLLNTLNRLNKKHSPTILFLHPVYLLYLPGNIKHSNPLFSDFPDRSMRYFLSEKL